MTNSERNIASHASEPSKVNALLIGQLAQRQSTVLTRRGSQVQSLCCPFKFPIHSASYWGRLNNASLHVKSCGEALSFTGAL